MDCGSLVGQAALGVAALWVADAAACSLGIRFVTALDMTGRVGVRPSMTTRPGSSRSCSLRKNFEMAAARSRLDNDGPSRGLLVAANLSVPLWLDAIVIIDR
jgi:hypothetical protein